MNRYLLLLAKFEVKVTEHAYKQVSEMELGGENARDKIKPRSGACLDHWWMSLLHKNFCHDLQVAHSSFTLHLKLK